ncbi:hypothetical protein [Algibacter sp. R77976]|uniref:hypothetical protein n=1 Tax=Algibacter sp. R77976 TaxID=3093873 RepID=UPI0037C7A5AD
MKIIRFLFVVTICLFFISSIDAQEKFKRFQLEFGYGASLSGDFGKNDYQIFSDFDFTIPLVGKNIEATLKYKLKNNRFIGIGYTEQSYVNTLNGIGVLGDRVLVFENYRLEEEVQYYELQYGKFFNNGLDFTISLFSIHYYQPILDVETINGKTGFVFSNVDPLIDDIGLSLALGCRIYEYNTIVISLRTRVFYSLNGLEAITLSPLVRVDF